MRRTILAQGVGFLLAAAPALAAAPYHTLHSAGSPYFGHVSWCEIRGDDLDPRVVREGRAESASLNVPVSPGDRLLTSEGRRCEVEFDTGTTVQLDGATGIRLETVLAASLTSERHLTNLVLESGRLRVRYQDYGGSEVFQLLTDNAGIKLERSAIVDITFTEEGETRLAVARGKAAVMFGPNERKVHKRTLKTGEGLTIRQHQGFAAPPTSGTDVFTQWALARDLGRALPPASGPPLPATLRDLSPVVVDFGERFSRVHGEWVWTRLKELAWRPRLNDEAGWSPYDRGRWTMVKGQPFWVAGEPWGWVPSHLGFWYLDDAAGWVWLPGSTFAPAWVTWAGCGDSLAWWPFGPRDWIHFRGRRVLSLPFCEDARSTWLAYPWSPDRPDPDPRPVEYAKPRSGGVPEPPPPSRPRPGPQGVPGELRQMGEQLDRLVERLGPPDRGRDSWPGSSSPASRRRLGGLAESLEDESPDPAHADDPLRASASPVAAMATVVVRHPTVAETRFRDWNPDVRLVREHGVSIHYDSERNRVICAGCRERADGGFEVPGSDSSGGAGGGGEDGGTAGSGAAAGAGADPARGGGTTRTSPIDR